MNSTPPDWYRRPGRTVVFVLLGHSHVIVTVPLSLGLIVQTIVVAKDGLSCLHFGTWDILRCVGVRVALAAFACTALLHLTAADYEG